MDPRRKTPPEGGAGKSCGGVFSSANTTAPNTGSQSLRYLLVDMETGRLDGWYLNEQDARGVLDYRQSISGNWIMVTAAGKGAPIGRAPFEAARRQILEVTP